MGENSKQFVLETLRGMILSTVITLVSILLFALIVKVANLSSSVIKPVNQFIKAISLFLGCFFSVKAGKGLIKGAIVGIVYTVFIYVLFSLIGGNAFKTGFFIDLIAGALIGALSGVISVNVKK